MADRAERVAGDLQRAWRLMPLALYYTVPQKTLQGKTPQKKAVQSVFLCADESLSVQVSRVW